MQSDWTLIGNFYSVPGKGACQIWQRNKFPGLIVNIWWEMPLCTKKHGMGCCAIVLVYQIYELIPFAAFYKWRLLIYGLIFFHFCSRRLPIPGTIYHFSRKHFGHTNSTVLVYFCLAQVTGKVYWTMAHNGLFFSPIKTTKPHLSI